MSSISHLTVPTLLLAAVSYGANPIPLINQPLYPTSIAPGSNAFTLVVSGAGFVNGSQVSWNGSPLVTTPFRPGLLKAVVPKSKVIAPGTALITVLNPGPGGGTSNAIPFHVTASLSTVMFFSRDSATDAHPNAVVTADFNHDGKLDIVTANGAPGLSGPGTISTLVGNGGGTFQSHVEYVGEISICTKGSRIWVKCERGCSRHWTDLRRIKQRT